jgi:hypothetical protein
MTPTCEARVDDACLRCHHHGLLQTLTTPSLPVKRAKL